MTALTWWEHGVIHPVYPRSASERGVSGRKGYVQRLIEADLSGRSRCKYLPPARFGCASRHVVSGLRPRGESPSSRTIHRRPEHAPRWSPNLNDSSPPVVIRQSGSATRKCASRKARVVHREAKLGRAHANPRAARTDHFHSMSPLAQRKHFLHCTNFPTARSVKSPVDPP
jgi:hypothetical protein